MRAAAQNPDRSPTVRRSLAGLLGGGATSWRQGLDGTGALVATFLGSTAVAFVLRSLRRR